MGLRERQKADRLRRILDAASLRFRRLGYDATRIEDIAEEAEVSVGTVYNYFGNKGDVLVAIVSLEVEEILDQGAALIANSTGEVGEAVEALISLYFDHSLQYLNKEMWRTAMALAIRSPDTPVSRRYTALDRRLAGQVCALIEALQKRGCVRRDLDATAVGSLVFNNLNMMFVEFAKDEGQDLATLKALVSVQNAPLLRLVRAQPLQSVQQQGSHG